MMAASKPSDPDPPVEHELILRAKAKRVRAAAQLPGAETQSLIPRGPDKLQPSEKAAMTRLRKTIDKEARDDKGA